MQLVRMQHERRITLCLHLQQSACTGPLAAALECKVCTKSHTLHDYMTVPSRTFWGNPQMSASSPLAEALGVSEDVASSYMTQSGTESPCPAVATMYMRRWTTQGGLSTQWSDGLDTVKS
jgi:hypothetical protein